MEEKQIDYLLIDRADDYLEREFSSRFEGGLKANMPATLYRFEGPASRSPLPRWLWQKAGWYNER